MSEIESNLGTMVINNSLENTMKQYGTAPGQQNYRPDFVDHFDQKDSGSHTSPPANSNANHQGALANPPSAPSPAPGHVQVPPQSPPQDVTSLEQQQAGRDLARQFQQIAGGASVSSPTGGGVGGGRTMDMDKFQQINHRWRL